MEGSPKEQWFQRQLLRLLNWVVMSLLSDKMEILIYERGQNLLQLDHYEDEIGTRVVTHWYEHGDISVSEWWGSDTLVWAWRHIGRGSFYDALDHLASHHCGPGSVLGLGMGRMCESLSVPCHRSVVSSGYSGFLHQWNWHHHHHFTAFIWPWL